MSPPKRLAEAQKAVQPSIDAVVETASNVVPDALKRPSASKTPSWIGPRPDRSPTPGISAAMKHPITIDFTAPGLQPPVFVGTSLSNPEWQPVEMDAKWDDNGEWKFSKTFEAEEGEYQYKLRLGPGDWWICDDSKPKVDDGAGNQNNQVIVKPKAAAAVEPATGPTEAISPPASIPEIKEPEPARKDSVHPAPLMKHESFEGNHTEPVDQKIAEHHAPEATPASPLLHHESLAPPPMPLDDDSDDVPEDPPLLRHESIAPSSHEQSQSPLFRHESISIDDKRHHDVSSHRPSHQKSRTHSNDSIPEEADENDPSLVRFPTDHKGIMEHIDRTRKSMQEDETSESHKQDARSSPAGSVVQSVSPSLPSVIEAEDGEEELAELREEAQQVADKDELPPDADVPEVTLPEAVERPAAPITPPMTPKEPIVEEDEDEDDNAAVDTPMNVKEKRVSFTEKAKEKAFEAAETAQTAGMGLL